MTKAEFKKEFDFWLLKYPNNPVRANFDDKGQVQVMASYYDDLKYYEISLLRRAMEYVLQESPIYFPTSPVIKSSCESVLKVKLAEGHLPRARYGHADHGCHLEGRQSMSHARRLLFELAPYEGFHVLCWGEAHPVCPECGQLQPQWENPMIVELMRLYPDDTELWNPTHKGTLLCEICRNIDGIDWVKKVYDRRAAEVRR